MKKQIDSFSRALFDYETAAALGKKGSSGIKKEELVTLWAEVVSKWGILREDIESGFIQVAADIDLPIVARILRRFQPPKRAANKAQSYLKAVSFFGELEGLIQDLPTREELKPDNAGEALKLALRLTKRIESQKGPRYTRFN